MGSAGAVSFGQIVKSAEPAFAAVLSQFVYKKKVSKAKWLCLPIIIGGVILASVKELDFAVSALVSACIANLFAAFKGNENKKLMDTEGVRDRLGSVGNQFAVTTILAFLMSVPVFVAKEGARWGQFVANTAKRVIVIVGVAIVLGESLDPIKLLGCGIGIGGVFLYSIIDGLLAKK